MSDLFNEIDAHAKLKGWKNPIDAIRHGEYGLEWGLKGSDGEMYWFTRFSAPVFVQDYLDKLEKLGAKND